MPKKHEIYKCELCGNIVEIVRAGSCVPTCCNQPLKLFQEGAVDAAKEKHVPVIEKSEGGYTVRVGSAEHPMLEKHYIEWIELLADNMLMRKELAPNDAPEAFFATNAEKVTARAYCNLHGLWKAEN
ncbi:MAG: desulfoferrodoxin [Desulfovibrionaceae bacterium]|nr:desulfoferrodoxin [Desulfovibrionaceae bacterium]